MQIEYLDIRIAIKHQCCQKSQKLSDYFILWSRQVSQNAVNDIIVVQGVLNILYRFQSSGKTIISSYIDQLKEIGIKSKHTNIFSYGRKPLNQYKLLKPLGKKGEKKVNLSAKNDNSAAIFFQMNTKICANLKHDSHYLLLSVQDIEIISPGCQLAIINRNIVHHL